MKSKFEKRSPLTGLTGKMAHFQFETGVNDCLRTFGDPITRGPVPRWQRKENERETRQNSLTASNGPLSPIQPQAANAVKPRTKTPSKTPSKTPRKKASKPSVTPNRGDRFIPNRCLVDVEWGHYQLVHGGESEEGRDIENLANVQELHKLKDERVNAAVGNSKILHFKSRAPAPKEGDHVLSRSH